MQRGITLLISVLILSSAMSIALGIAYIVLTEFNINRTARESYGAFYAADFGKECAMYYHSGNADPDLNRLHSFWDPDNPCYENDGIPGVDCVAPSALKCGFLGAPVTHISNPPGCDRSVVGCEHIFDATINNTIFGLNLCTNLHVVSTVLSGGSVTTLIESHGVNDCNFSGSSVNRSIEVCLAPAGLSC